jgi:MYXO-CTERM domain-containing protein
VKEGERIKSTYLSTLAPYRVYKGLPPYPLLIRGYWYDWTSIWYATDHQYPIPKGWAGKLYLHDLPDGTYAEVWWNGKVEDLQKTASETLPPCVPLVFDLFDSGTPIPFADGGVVTLADTGADTVGAAVDGPNPGGCSSGGGEVSDRSVLCMPSLVGLLLLVALLLVRRRMHDE